MYCKYCGKQIDDDSVYCRYCGKKVVENKETAETKPAADEELDYEVINEKTYHSDFHIRFKDGNCLFFSYIDDETVAVVAPNQDWHSGEPVWYYPYPSLKGHLNIPNFVRNNKKYLVTKIENSAFKNCSSLQSIDIPDSVTEIGESVFLECNSLQSIIIPSSVKKIEDLAFYECSSLQSIAIPNSVTEIGRYAFYGCSGLQSIVIPDSVKFIRFKAFQRCSDLQSIVIPNSVIAIETSAFNRCSSLQSIVIHNSVKSIGYGAFRDCSSLQSIVIPDSVTTIGDRAFENCSSLQSIVIPDSLNKIGLWALCNCNSLEFIYVSKKKLKFFMEELSGYENKIKVWEGKDAKAGLINTVGKTSNVSPYYLFFDTETTGIPLNYNAPTSDSSNWPRLVQLSWIVTDKDCRVLQQHDHIIYPNGFSIPNDAARIHGITTKIAQAKGIPLQKAIEEFLADFNKVEIIVGHNIAFDKKIVGAELIRLGKKDVMQTKTSRCTMESSTDFCKIYARNGGYKWPKLQELHKKLFGCEFEDAHNSMSDVTATLDCFRELKKRGIM